MSIGMRVMHYGYDFVWLGSKKLPPYYITPSGRIVVMEVIEDIPYLRSGSAECQPRVATRTVRVPAAPAPAHPDFVGYHDLPVPDFPVSAAEAPPTPIMPPVVVVAPIPPPLTVEVVPGLEERALPDLVGLEERAPPDPVVVPVPPPPAVEVVLAGELRKERDLRAEAKTTRHLLLHRPFNKYCDGCKLGKMIEKKHFKGAFQRELKKWGDIVTADHLVSKKSIKKKNTMLGCTGHTNALNMMDVWSRMKNCYPVRDKTHEEAVRSFKHFCGDRKIGRVYSDNSGELIKATKAVKVNHESSQPGVPVSNAIAERNNQDILNGTKAALETAGLPACVWPYAAPHA